ETLGETRVQHRRADHEQRADHDHRGVRESRQPFGGSEDPRDQERGQREERYEIQTQSAIDEEDDRDGQDAEDQQRVTRYRWGQLRLRAGGNEGGGAVRSVVRKQSADRMWAQAA